MFTTVISIGLLSLASSVPLAPRQVVPHYPPSSQSTGFKLVANATDPTNDMAASVNGLVLQGIHVGAGLNDAALGSDTNNSRIFYQNGTAEELRYNQGDILSDGGTPIFPWGIQVANQNASDPAALRGVTVDAGSGTVGVSLAHFPDPYVYLTALGAGKFVACDEYVRYYNQNFTTVRYVTGVQDPATALYTYSIPENCVAINLIPECAALPDLPEGSISSHEFAASAKCYADVSAINWPEYGP
ncbi:Uu.00g042770.m01.CDS01 [Anthostomella pinea]|uniref:Uu.00g042770.m01.CDS01 n=1 Tax=Anthostomella pinea TaxID=933095 RepID=A0AAI8VAL4_9PEZI|nr:Uu.00g042770.m01.CDS01 [Anthostomella pinea]